MSVLPTADDRGWIGPRPAAAQIGAILFVGVAGILFAGVGPLLLGGLEASGRISPAQLGQAGTAELLTMGIAAGLAGPLWGLRRLRLLTMLCGLAMAVLNALSIFADGWAVVLVRGINGIPSGALIWLMTAMIVRSSRPDRWAAIYLTVQTLAQAVIVFALGALVEGAAGVGAGFAVLAAIGAATALGGLLVPGALSVLPTSADEPSGRPSGRGLLALAAAFAFNAGILAVWIYVEPLSRQAGHPAGTAGHALALSLGAQVAGGLAATLIAGRVPTAPVLVISLLGMGGAMFVLAALPGVALFLAVSALFGFLWMFASPFFTPLVIDADPTRRAAMFGSGAALLGCSAGPFLASLLVGDADVRQCLTLGVALLATSLAIVMLLYFSRTRSHSLAL
ncbi:MAG: MFS transporter [Sphingomonas sp.]|uniref:MFS transporter n=1 Tax=Sphingomonas sp. TaxID=28214 RepID=UPI003F81A4C1